MTYKRNPPPLKPDESRITIRPGDSVIVIRRNPNLTVPEVEVRVNIEPGKAVEPQSLLALGLMWCMEDYDWKLKVMHRAADRIRDIKEGREK